IPRIGTNTTGTWMISGWAGSPNTEWISTGHKASETTAATATIVSHGGRLGTRAGLEAGAIAGGTPGGRRGARSGAAQPPAHARPTRALRHQRRRPPSDGRLLRAALRLAVRRGLPGLLPQHLGRPRDRGDPAAPGTAPRPDQRRRGDDRGRRS